MTGTRGTSNISELARQIAEAATQEELDGLTEQMRSALGDLENRAIASNIKKLGDDVLYWNSIKNQVEDTLNSLNGTLHNIAERYERARERYIASGGNIDELTK